MIAGDCAIAAQCNDKSTSYTQGYTNVQLSVTVDLHAIYISYDYIVR